MNREKKFFALEISLLIAFIFTIVLSSAVSTDKTCDEIKDKILRLHVIANSDTEEDQSLKLKVRDELLRAGSELFEGTATAENAAEISKSEIGYLTDIAQGVINENGFDYEAKIEVGKSRFPTREYENITLPAGEYTAVRVILGEGEGHNWWCVMFPPMCLPAAENETDLDDVLSDEAIDFVESGRRFKVKFKIIEWYEKIKENFED